MLTKILPTGFGRQKCAKEVQSVKLSIYHQVSISDSEVTNCYFRVKPFICTMPMRLDDGWNQIQVQESKKLVLSVSLVQPSCKNAYLPSHLIIASPVQPGRFHTASLWHKLCGDPEGKLTAAHDSCSHFCGLSNLCQH